MTSNVARVVLFSFAIVAVAAILVTHSKQDSKQNRENAIRELKSYKLEIDQIDEKEIHIRASSDKIVSLDRLTELMVLAQELDGVPLKPTILDLTDCPKIQSFDGAWRLRELRSIIAIDCEGLQSLRGIAGLPDLVELVLQENAALTDLSALRNLSSLVTIDLTNSHMFKSLPLQGLPSLENLYLSGCRSVETLNVTELTELRQLFLDSCSSLTALKGIDQLKNLTDLDVSNCDGIGEDLRALPALESLEVFDMRNVEMPDFSLIGKLSTLKSLRLGGQSGFETMEPFSDLKNLEEIYFEACPGLTTLKGMPAVKRRVSFVRCENLRTLFGLGHSTEVEMFDASGCINLADIDDLKRLKKLKQLNFSNCEKVRDISQLVENPELLIILLGRSGVTPSSVGTPIKVGPNKGLMMLKPPLNEVFKSDETVFDFSAPQ